MAITLKKIMGVTRANSKKMMGKGATNLELYSHALYSDASFYYRLEGNSNDAKGAANGSDSNMTYGTSYGMFNQGAHFNGSSSTINIGDHLDGATTFSFTAWIRKAAVGAGSGLIYFKSDVLMFGNYDGSSTFRFRVHAAGWADTAAVDYPYGTNEWHMVTGTFEAAGGANNLKLYLDGLLWQVGTSNNAGISGGDAIMIGGRAGEYFNGDMDDIGWFTKVLSAAEVLSLYNNAIKKFMGKGNA